MRRRQELRAWDKRYVWHPFTQMKDWEASEDNLIIAKAKGNYLIDLDGKRYFDGVSSLWVTLHGHSHPALNKAVREQVKKLDHSTLLGLGNVPSIKLARELVAMAPKGLNKVFYSDSGSTAMEIALKMAYQYWQNLGQSSKRHFVTFREAYHGDTIGSVSLGGIDLFHKVYRKLLFPTIRIPTPYGSGDAAKLKPCLSEIEKLFRKRSKEIAAIVVEPLMQGAAGMLKAPPGLLLGIRELCSRYEVLLICDEVATGFGRTGTMFACEQEKVSPDIMALAKGLSGGILPLAATLSNQKVYRGFVFPYRDQKTLFHGHTFSGNPIACAAALASLKIFKAEKTLARLQGKIACFQKRSKELLKNPHVAEIRQVGLMMGIELIKDKEKGLAYDWSERMGIRVCQKIRDYGIVLRPLGNTIVLMPPLSSKVKELDRLFDKLEKCIDAECSQGKRRQ